MTIRFTSSSAGYALGSIVSTLSPAAEAALVVAGVATYDSVSLQSPTGAIAQTSRVLGQSGIPTIMVPNGTVATAGVVTLGTALGLTYPAAWIFLPAGAVVGGLEGWYYTVFSSTTVGQVYSSYLASMLVPYIPTALTAAVGSNSAYTQVIAQKNIMGAATVRAGIMGLNGAIRYTGLYGHLSSAGAKNARLDFGGSNVNNSSNTTSAGMTQIKQVQNRGVANSQVIHATPVLGAVSAVAPTLLAIDTAADVVASFTGQIAVATDWIVLEAWSVELMPGAN